MAFESLEKKKEITTKRRLLAGTSIFINNDLTREQMAREKELREKRRKLLKQPEFKDKKIRIYNGKLLCTKQTYKHVRLARAMHRTLQYMVQGTIIQSLFVYSM